MTPLKQASLELMLSGNDTSNAIAGAAISQSTNIMDAFTKLYDYDICLYGYDEQDAAWATNVVPEIKKYIEQLPLSPVCP